MSDRWGEDPLASGARRLWARVRIPLGVVVLAGNAVQLREPLLSGEVFATLTAVMVLAFLAWLFLLHGRGRRALDPTDAETIRSWARREVLAWSSWLVVGGAWLTTATVRDAWVWQRVVVVAVPLLLLLLNLPALVWPERLAARAAQARAARS